jgi:hypothetical protein
VLTYAGARERSRLISVLGYQVDLDLTGGGEVFGSATVVRFRCRRPGAGSFVELRPARLCRAVLNGRELNPATLGWQLPCRGHEAALMPLTSWFRSSAGSGCYGCGPGQGPTG